jgi:hypothetical protein
MMEATMPDSVFVPVTKDSFKEMSAPEKERVISEFKQECIYASGDVQSILDFTADVILLSNKLPTKLDFTKLVAAINGENVSDPKTLDKSPIADEGGEDAKESE